MWIKVSDRLPEQGNRVIGYDAFYDRVGEAVIASWNASRLVFIDSDDCDITHWQPFPDRPAA